MVLEPAKAVGGILGKKLFLKGCKEMDRAESRRRWVATLMEFGTWKLWSSDLILFVKLFQAFLVGFSVFGRFKGGIRLFGFVQQLWIVWMMRLTQFFEIERRFIMKTLAQAINVLWKKLWFSFLLYIFLSFGELEMSFLLLYICWNTTFQMWEPKKLSWGRFL